MIDSDIRLATWKGSQEPRLSEVLADPLVRQVMARDGLRPEEVRRVLADWPAARKPGHAA